MMFTTMVTKVVVMMQRIILTMGNTMMTMMMTKTRILIAVLRNLHLVLFIMLRYRFFVRWKNMEYNLTSIVTNV